MRHGHWLKGNANSELPRHLIFVDTEAWIEQETATRQRHTLRLGSACYVRIRDENGRLSLSEDWLEFITAEDFWVWCSSKARPGFRVWVFCHNWNYDAGLLSVSVEPEKLGWKPYRYVNEGPPFLIKFRRDRATLQLVDSLNYFSGSLASIGRSIGVHKDESPEWSAPDEILRPYNRQDVEVLKEAVLRFRTFVEEHDLGNFQWTLASQAFTAYKHRFMDTPIFIHSNEEALQLERESYHGGRVECFRLGEITEPLYYLDVNSMYPFVMKTERYPTSLKQTYHGWPMSVLVKQLEQYAIIARVQVKTETPVYPLVYGSKLVFPVGSFTTTLSTPELIHALAHGHLERVFSWAKYEQHHIFGDYVDTLYSLRQQYQQEGNGTFAYMAKIMLNSLYGKFGQNGQVWAEVGVADDTHPTLWISQETPDSPIIKHRVRMGMVQDFKRSGESYNSFPAIASHVTAYARMYLWQLMEEAGHGNVVYCDTDSLIVTGLGKSRLSRSLFGGQIGQLKEEASTTRAVFYGPKEYVFGPTTKRKGIRWNAEQVGEATWEQDRFTSWDYLHGKREDGYIIVTRVRKTLRRVYTKGIVGEDGIVTPIRLGEEK